MYLNTYFDQHIDLGKGVRQFFEESLNLNLQTPTEKPIPTKAAFKDKDSEKLSDLESIYFAGKLSDKTFRQEGENSSLEETEKEIERGKYDSILVFGVELNIDNPSRSRLSEITRWLNRRSLGVPVAVVFRYNRCLAFANSERLPFVHQKNEGEKVGKVVMLKDVFIENTHAAHLKIILGDGKGFDGLKIDEAKINSFEKLYQYWQSVFALQTLNDQFYADLQNWFYYALENINLPFCPNYLDKKENGKNFLVRLLSRTLFCWFVKEKGLIRKELLELEDWEGNKYPLVHDISEKNFLKSNSYYRGILQNIFFNALNQADKKSLKDFKWTNYLHSDFALNWLTDIPYLNGGIFDKLEEDNAKESIEDGAIQIPNFLFYGIETEEKVHVGRGKTAREEVQKVEHKGLNGILKSYKFTLDENTPYEEDVALDPEMLGLVFENLLAELDPNLEDSIKKSIRKLTGSYYTPRKVILEMVNDSLFLYLTKYLVENVRKIENAKQSISNLIYKQEVDTSETKFCDAIVEALDKYKVLDPACGSGAFPMVMLHRMVDILKLVDPDNERWLKLKLKNVDAAQRVQFEKVLKKHLDDYSRKLGIIRDSIYGLDIQPLAVQITKLRFFISLLIDQNTHNGITPMPNIETKIICADSLKNIQVDLFSNDAIDRLTDARARYYQPDISHEEREKITNEIIDVLDQAFPFFAKQVTGKSIPGQNPVLLKEWFTHSTLAAPFFNMDFFYPELKDDGFDCVIGNPPYGGVKISEDVRSALDIESKDPYGAFIARFLNDANKLTPLKHGGVLAYIVSDTFMTIKSHLKLRKKLMQNYVHKMIRVHPDTFRATVNTAVMVAERNNKKEIDDKHICLMADMTNISIHDNYEHFVEVLGQTRGADFEGSDMNLQVSNEEYAIYYYPQSLIRTNSNLPFFVASPKLFALMNDGNDKLISPKSQLKEIAGKQVNVRKLKLNEKNIELVKLGDIGAAPHGISTGNNKKYVRVKLGTKGSYDKIEAWMVFPSNKLSTLSRNEKINGLDKDWNNLTECFVPFEKGGESDSDDGWLPNYYVPTQFFINWAKGAILDMKNNPGVAWKNEKYFFKKGLTFSISGIYAPTFRLNSKGVFEAKGSGLFCEGVEDEKLLGILSSKFAKFIFKNFIKHTVDTSGDDIAAFVLNLGNQKVLDQIKEFVKEIIYQQKDFSRYDYASHEQIEIDKLVYKAYGLNPEDIQAVEDWFARRYPKLSAAQKANLRKLGKSDDYLELYEIKKWHVK
ncbi:Eco57I restriction-modification methylase domain-containing protein [Cyclobacterium sp. SYSU L10401]|uniref:Eco57I restriction-modification methylase domain-containing protein n=1 Tax=Cyclobacterium sp. SYSU L10401 TaxID=2678657 RepID=UPI0013D81FDE|nr:Eco57I restriction-modification methylase domain-containing protein [Cyclobacterium sp. SYSU L10401]